MLTLERKTYQIQCYRTRNASFRYPLEKFNENCLCVTNGHVYILIRKYLRNDLVTNRKKKKRWALDEEGAATVVVLD